MYSDDVLGKMETVDNLVKEIWRQFGEKYTKVEISSAVTIIEAVMLAWGNCETCMIESIRESQNHLIEKYKKNPRSIDRQLGIV